VEFVLGSIRPLVVRYCRARLGRIQRTFACADGVAEEVCVAVLNGLSRHVDRGEPFLAFVFGIARHEVSNVQHATSEPHAEVPVSRKALGEPDQSPLSFESFAQMACLLAPLPDAQREVLILRLMNGLSAEETAEAVGSTAAAVRMTQHRALEHLRAALN
jgi:RNA polymerase sigma-70 factor (ECF subfamily)